MYVCHEIYEYYKEFEKNINKNSKTIYYTKLHVLKYIVQLLLKTFWIFIKYNIISLFFKKKTVIIAIIMKMFLCRIKKYNLIKTNNK